MDIQSIRTLFELKAMQNLSSDNAQSVFSESDQSLFSDLLNDLLNSATDGQNVDAAQIGEAVNQLQNSSIGAAFFNSAEGQSLLASNPYLAQFLLENESLTATAGSTSQSNTYISTDALAPAQKYAEEISKAASTYNVPEKLLASIMKQESNFNPTAISAAGAQGLMQLMPQTAKYVGVSNWQDPEQNIMGGAKYLRQMLDKFDNNTELALAAYNAGPGNVTKYNGIPPFKETQNYVKKIMNYFHS